ncbi:hypothetical protein, partial [Enterobacter intestinihominis]
NNTLRLLPGGGGLAPAYGYLVRVIAPPPRHSNHKSNTKTKTGKIKKKIKLSLFSLSHIKIYEPTRQAG